MENIAVRLKDRVELIDITSKIQDIITLGHMDDGLCQIFVPHTSRDND